MTNNIEAAISAYLNGERLYSIMKKYNIGTACLYKELKSRNVTTRNKKKCDINLDQIMEEHERGSSPDQIAERAQVPQYLVKKCLLDRGIKPNRKQIKPSEDFLNRRKEMISLYESGQTYEQIGARYNVSRQRIQQILAGHVSPRERTQYRSFKDRTAELRGKIGLAVVNDFKSGKTKQSIMQKYDISHIVLDKILYENNVNKEKIPIEKALELRKSGLSYAEIAKQINSSAMTVFRHLSKYGLGNRVKEICDTLKQELLEGLKAGVSADHLAKKHGVSCRSVIKVLLDSDLSLKIAEEYNQGATIEDLSERYAVSRWAIDRIVRTKTQKRERTQFPIEKAIELHKQGKRTEEISAEIGFSIQTVRKHLTIRMNVIN